MTTKLCDVLYIIRNSMRVAIDHLWIWIDVVVSKAHALWTLPLWTVIWQGLLNKEMLELKLERLKILQFGHIYFTSSANRLYVEMPSRPHYRKANVPWSRSLRSL